MSNELARWFDRHGETTNKLMSELYVRMLSYVDQNAAKLGLEPLTERCPVAEAARTTYEDFATGRRSVKLLTTPEMILLIEFDAHIISEHSNYIPLLDEALEVPGIAALAEQVKAANDHVVGLAATKFVDALLRSVAAHDQLKIDVGDDEKEESSGAERSA